MPQALSAKQRVLAEFPAADFYGYKGHWMIIQVTGGREPVERMSDYKTTINAAWADAAAKLPARTGE